MKRHHRLDVPRRGGPTLAAGVVALLCATSCLAETPAGGTSGQVAASDSSRVRASGHATVSAAPDRAIVDLGVSSEAPEAAAAARANAERTRAVLAALRKAFADVAEIETTGYRLSPRYTFQQGGGRTLEGFTAWSGVRVKSRDVEAAGRIIDVAVAAGAGEVGGIRFDLASDAAQREAALALAAKDARRRAAVIAEALGLKLIRVVAVEEGASGIAPLERRARTMALSAESDSTPTEPGGVETHADVSIEVEVGP
jgi:hypothetical protein